MRSSSSMDPRIAKTLDRDNHKPFEDLISDLMTSSNEQRSQAESLFNLCKQTNPDTLVAKLANLLEHSPRLEARAMSAILLRNLFKQTDPNTLVVQDELPLWNSLLEWTQVSVKRGLLNCVANEQNKWIIIKLGDTILELAANILADNGWPELMPFIFNRVASADFWLQESALLILARLAQYVGDSLWPHITLLPDVFMNCLGNVGSLDVRIAALIAVINFIQCLQSSIDRDRFQDLLPGMMRCLTDVLNDGDEATAQEAFNLLIELAKTEPRFFRGQLVKVVGNMLQIAEVENLEEGTRDLAIEFVITLVDAREQEPGMMRDLPPLFISRLFAILMRMLDFDEDVVGQECLHRLETALGGDAIVPVAYDQLSAYLAAPEWHKHLAALVAVAQIAKGCSKMNKDLKQVVTKVLNSFQDPDPRVRWAAINEIEQLSTCVGPSLQDQYQDHVLHALASALDDVNPQVQAHAFSTVLHFSSHCSPSILERYMDRIVNNSVVLPEEDLNIKVFKLANSLKYYSTDVDIRAKSVIELGEMFEKPLAVLTQHLVKDTILRCVQEERDRTVHKSLCHTIARFYNVLCIKTGWPELIYFVETSVVGYNHFLETAMLILGPLRLFMKDHPMSLLVHKEYLENKYRVDIRIAAFGAAIGYIRCTYGVMDEDLVAAMSRVLTEGLNEGEEVTTQEALKLLSEWAHQIKHQWSGFLSESYDAKLLSHLKEYFSGRQLVWFVSSAIEIAESQSLEIETRHLAIDFVITLAEGRDSDNELMINKLFVILISDIENEAASYCAENEDDDAGELRNFSVLLKFLDRLAAFRLDKDSVAWPKLEQYLGASEWRKRVIAINILAHARISKVYLKVTNNLDQLVTKVLDLFQDPHHRVRLAAFNATHRLSTDLDPDLQFEYNSHVLPSLAEAMCEDPDPHVRLAAINVTVQLFADLDPDLTLTDENHDSVIQALHGAICDFEYFPVQDRAVYAMINISMKYPEVTPRYLPVTVGTLLRLRRREDIASDQTRIRAIRNILEAFEEELPHDTWTSTFNRLRPDQQAEFRSILEHDWFEDDSEVYDSFEDDDWWAPIF